MNNNWLTIEHEGKSVNLTRCSSTANGEIIIPDGVTDIEFDAFKGCKEVTSIIFPDSVINIWENALCDTAWYKNQPDGVVYAGKVVLYYKGEMPENTSLTFKEGTLGIADVAFRDCNNLVSVNIPDGCLHIGMEAFAGCIGLTNISIPKSVVSVDMYAFEGTPWYENQPSGIIYVGSLAYEYRGIIPDNTTIEIKDGTISVGDYLFDFYNGLTSIIIPSSVSVIGSKAFQNLPNLESIIVSEDNPIYDSRDNCNAIIETSTNSLLFGCKSTTIPKGVVKIEDEAFIGCTGLSSLVIPDSVTSIGEKAFWGCSGLASIVVDKNNPIFDDRDNCNAIFLTSTDALIVGCKATTIPQGTKIIGDNAFAECPSINHIEFPEGIERISRNAFYGCKNLRSLLFPNSLKVIGEQAFRECTHLRSVNIPESVETIENFAFYGCNNMLTAYIPQSVKSIGDCAFDEHQTKVIKKGSIMNVVDFWKQYVETHNNSNLNRDEFCEGLNSCVPDWETQIRDKSLWPNLTGHSGYPNESTLFRVILDELGVEFANFVIETEWGKRHMEACASLDYCASRIHSNWNDFSNITKSKILEFHLKQFLDYAAENNSFWPSLEDSFKNSVIEEAISCEKDYISDILLFKIWKEDLHFSGSSYIYFVTNKFQNEYRDIRDNMNRDRERRDDMQNRGRIRRNRRMDGIPTGWDIPLLSFGRDEEDHFEPMIVRRGINRPEYHPSGKILQIQEVLNIAGDQDNLSKLRSAIVNIRNRFIF